MNMNILLQEKLKTLPVGPGVYFHKNAAGEIIYIGKAAVLKNRVRQYFQKSRTRDAKTELLVEEIHDTDWTEVESEIDALFLEAELIRRYLPPYNILLRDDKSLSYVRIDIKSDSPTVTMTRRPLDDGAEYFGPYMSGFAVKKSLRLLRRIFPFATSEKESTMGSKLYEQLGLDPGLASGKTSIELYRKNLRVLMRYLTGDKQTIVNELDKDMRQAAREQRFEDAARARNQLSHLGELKKQIIFSDREFLDMSKDLGLAELTDILGLGAIPRRIEGFDISHMSGTDTVASMVVFSQGLPDKGAYRKFKMLVPGNDDFAHIHEVVSRRTSAKNRKAWGLPDLFLIDGGKGQLSAALRALKESGIDRPAVGLAKEYEQIVVKKRLAGSDETYSDVHVSDEFIASIGGTVTYSDDFMLINIPHTSHVVKLLQRIRDESHRFAVTYHSVLKLKRQTVSILDSVPGIGPDTKKKLLREFGSLRGVMQARQPELEKILGVKKAEVLKMYIRAENRAAKSL
jgi:excinuclease ABC subunit C